MKNIFKLVLIAGVLLEACNEKAGNKRFINNTLQPENKDSIVYFYRDSTPLITEFRGEHDCHGCYGGGIIKRGSHTDTIFGGTWGNPPFWFEQKTEDKHSLVVINKYFSGDFTESSLRV